MDKRETTPLGHWLRAAMDARGIGVNQLAEYAEVAASAISAILTGKTTDPTVKTLEKLAAYFHVSPDVMLDLLPSRVDTGRIPTSTLLDQATGLLMVAVVEQRVGAGPRMDIVDYIYLPPSMAAKRTIAALRVHGDCMAPQIANNDVVVVEREADWQDGRIVLARVDDALIVKRAYQEAGRVRLHPDNSTHPDVYVADSDVLGVVIQIIKRPI